MREPSNQDLLYAWYFAALQHGAGSPQAPIHADNPQCGYFRLKGKDGISLPAYIAVEGPIDPDTGELAGDEKLICKISNVARDPYAAWTWLAGHPVPYESFKQAWDTGRWPEQAPGANFQAADSLEGLTDQLNTMLANAEQFKIIDNQVKCDQAANLKDRLLECHKALDAMRIAEKKPHDAAAAAVQAKFLPWIGKARDGVDALRSAMTPYLAKVENEAKAALRAAGGAGAAAQFDTKARAGGMSGKRTSTRTSKIAVIVDYDKALEAVKNRDEIKAAVQKVVTALVKAGATVPGVEAREEVKVI
jgi:hypothetical protein